MISNLLTDKTLASNFDLTLETVNIQVQVGALLQFAWHSVTGTTDGILEVFIVNGELATKISEIDIASTSNLTDCYAIQLNYIFESIRLKYTKNNITGGTLSVNCTQIKLRG